MKWNGMECVSQVASLRGGGLASNHGLRIGDLILSVDGRHLLSCSGPRYVVACLLFVILIRIFSFPFYHFFFTPTWLDFFMSFLFHLFYPSSLY